MASNIPFVSSCILLVVLSSNILLASCNLIADLRAACPHSQYCTGNTWELTSTTSRGSCCQDCFCDEKCALFGDCCPDYENDGRTNEGIPTQLECKPFLIENGYYKSNESRPYQLQSLRIIDFCPADNNNEKCAGNQDQVPDFDDMVVVSDKKTGAPYKNKYCAECHGVFDIVRWELGVLRSRVPLSRVPLLASQLNQYLYNNTIIVPIPGDNVPLTARSTQCEYDARCPEDGADVNVVNGCVNGPIMPFYYGTEVNGAPRVYKNAMCYECSSGRDVPSTCTSVYDNNSKAYSLAFLLDMTQFENTEKSSKIPSNNLCTDDEQFDAFTKKCRRLYCPPLEAASSSGKCLPIGAPGVVRVPLLFLPTDKGNKPTRFSKYNQTRSWYYLNYINEILDNRRCNFTRFLVYEVFDRDSQIVEYLAANIQYRIDDSCTMGYISEKLSKAPSLDIAWQADNGKSIKTKGKIVFIEFDNLGATDPRLDHSVLVQLHSRIPPVIIIVKFFLCPYYVLEIDEYKHLMNMSDRGVAMDENSTAFTAFTETLHGFYPVSETELAVCVQSYVAYVSSGGFSTCCFVPKFIMTLVFLTTRIYQTT